MLESQPNKKNWCSSVKDLLCQLGFHYVWFFQDIGNSNIFLKLVKQRIRDNFIQGWNGRINNSSRASLYKHLLSFEFKPYLDSVKINKFRTAFARLRVSSHRLRIETGRWSKLLLFQLMNASVVNVILLMMNSILYVNVHYLEIFESNICQFIIDKDQTCTNLLN